MEIYLSKSSIETYLQCGAKFDYRYIKKIESIENDREKESAIFGQLIHKVQEDYHKNGKRDNIIDLYHKNFKEFNILGQEFFELGNRMVTDYVLGGDNGNKTIGLEYEFKIFLDNGVPVKGVIDRIDEISDEEVEIIDYKTGFSRPLTPDQLSRDLQLGIYNLVINQLMPKYKRVKLTLDYLHYGKISCYRTKEQLEGLGDYLHVTYQKILTSIEKGSGLEPTVNSYCSFCQYRAMCPAFKEVALTNFDAKEETVQCAGLIAKESGIVVPIEKLDSFLDAIKAKIKILEKVQQEAEAFILEYIEKNGESGSARIGKTNYSTASKKYQTYDVETVLELLKENKGLDPNTLLSTQKTAIDAAFKSNKEAQEKLKKTVKISYSKSYLK